MTTWKIPEEARAELMALESAIKESAEKANLHRLNFSRESTRLEYLRNTFSETLEKEAGVPPLTNYSIDLEKLEIKKIE